MALSIERKLDPADQGLRWALVVTACFIVGSVTFLYLVTEDNEPVLLPTAAILVVCAIFVAEMQRRTPDEAVILDLGVIFMAVVTVYAFYPLLTYLANGLAYTEYSNRLYNAMPTPQEIGQIAWYYWAFLISFAVAYLATRGRTSRAAGWEPKNLDRRAIIAIVLLFVVGKVFLWGVGLFHDMSFESYSESYLTYRRLPLFVRQIAAHVSGIMGVLRLVVLFVLFQNYRKWKWVIWGWLAVQVVATFLHLGQRTEAVLLVFAATIMYHYLVKPIRWGPALCAGLVAIILFLTAGALRSAVASGETDEPLKIVGSGSEFEVLFGNAYDLHQRKLDGDIEPLPATFYLADFVGLVPQQFLPFKKAEASVWYLETYYPAVWESGGGVAFGIIPESIVGFGMPELILRGALVGWLLALFARRFSRRRPTAWSFLFHMWLTMTCYHIVRNTTFSILGLFFWGFLPVYVFVKAVEALCADDTRTIPAKA